MLRERVIAHTSGARLLGCDMKNRQRNNYARLPFEVRQRVLAMLYDGAEYDDIRNAPEIKAACEQRKIVLHNATFLAVRRGEEYRQYGEALAKTSKRIADDRWAAAALQELSGLTSVSDVTQMALLRQLRVLSENPDMDAEETLKLVNATVKIKSTELDKRVQHLQEKLAESNRLREAAEQEWKLREAELLVKLAAKDAKIAELEKLIPGVDSRQVADAMDEKFGV